MKHKFCDIFLSIWLLYYLASVLFSQGNLIRSLLFYLAIGSLFLTFVYSLVNCNYTKTLKSLTLFLALLLCYGAILWISGDTVTTQSGMSSYNGRSYVQSLMFSMFPIYAGYLFTEIGICNSKKMKVWTLFFLALSIILFIHNRNELLLSALTDDVTNNAGYIIASFIPILTLFHRRLLWQVVLLIICSLLVIFGMKRGAMLVCGLSVLYTIWANIKDKSDNNKKFSIMLLSFLPLAGIYYFFNKLMQLSDFFNTRIMLMLEGDSQQRGVITEQIFSYLADQSSLTKWLFGSGAYTTIKHFVNFAHNDWLEIIVCQGLLGVSMYFVFFYSFYKDCVQQKDIELKTALYLIFIFLFVRTFFSMSYGDIPFFLSFFIGYCFSKVHQSEPLIDD